MPERNGRTGRAPVLLVLVLLLVVAAFVLLVTGLVTNRTSWAWGSVATSAVAGVLLVTDWITRPRARALDPPDVQPPVADTGAASRGDTPAETAVGRREPSARRTGVSGSDEPSLPPDQPTVTPPARSVVPPIGGLDPEVEPGEEEADAADAIAVADLEYEVVVIDERPRYHLAGCRWVGDRETISLPVREARDLGFSPCAICAPDAGLAARHRLANR